MENGKAYFENNEQQVIDALLKLADAPLNNGTKEILGHQFYFEFDDRQLPFINLFDIIKTKKEYIHDELDWYKTQSLNVNTIGEKAKLWKQVCDKRGFIHSNYGFLIYNSFNGNQFDNVVKELRDNHTSRRAVMYYTNPFMHYIGDKDHVCTLAVCYYFREGKLHAHVFMRSQDIIFGLLNDLPWQFFVLDELCCALAYPRGNMFWTCGSLHIYERHFDKLYRFIEEYKRNELC